MCVCGGRWSLCSSVDASRQHTHTASNKRLSKRNQTLFHCHAYFISVGTVSVFFCRLPFEFILLLNGFVSHFTFHSSLDPQIWEKPSDEPLLRNKLCFYESIVKLKLTCKPEGWSAVESLILTWHFTTAEISVVLVFSLLCFLMPSCFITVDWIPSLELLDF